MMLSALLWEAPQSAVEDGCAQAGLLPTAERFNALPKPTSSSKQAASVVSDLAQRNRLVKV